MPVKPLLMNPNTKTAQSNTCDTFDPEGFLRDLNQWSETLAVTIATSENIHLQAEHWQIIHVTRLFYQRFERSPNMRALSNFIKQEIGSNEAKSIYLLTLFPGSPAKIISKIAGLPKPENCL